MSASLCKNCGLGGCLYHEKYDGFCGVCYVILKDIDPKSIEDFSEFCDQCEDHMRRGQYYIEPK